MQQAYEKIAKVLKTDQDIIKNLEQNANDLNGKKGVLDKILKENQAAIEKSLAALGLAKSAGLAELTAALAGKVKSGEEELKKMFGQMDFAQKEYSEKLLKFVRDFVHPPKGLFLKQEKARELLLNQPPQNILRFLGYKNVVELLKTEDLAEVYASLRFGEDSQWLNKVFFRQYQALTPHDFEERATTTLVLSPRLTPLAQEFVRKKYHNVSHLKELGVIFIIPTQFNQSGQLMKIFSLLFHYFYEVQFYSDLFKDYAKERQTFAQKLISLLRGDTPEPRLDLSSKSWLVIQRYLEKEDANELSLLVPHINPESIHWTKAQNDIARISPEFAFWDNLDWAGDFFKDEVFSDVLLSFNLVDTAMSLADENIQKKYTYHQREALWNKIFSEYFGWEALEKSAKDNILTGEIKYPNSLDE